MATHSQSSGHTLFPPAHGAGLGIGRTVGLALLVMVTAGPALSQTISYPCPGGLRANCAPSLDSHIDVFAEIEDDGTLQIKRELFEDFATDASVVSGSSAVATQLGGPVLGPVANASAQAAARTDYGVNGVWARSTGSGVGHYLTEAGDPDSKEYYYVYTNANAYSTWREVWTADTGGLLSTSFHVEGVLSHITTGSIEPGFDRTESGGSWGLRVTLWSLDDIVCNPFCSAKRSFWQLGSGNQIGEFDEVLSIVNFEMKAGQQYLLDVDLSVNAGDWADTDFFNSATIGELVLEEGLTLRSASGTSYPIAATLPAPPPFALMMAGALGVLARRWSASTA